MLDNSNFKLVSNHWSVCVAFCSRLLPNKPICMFEVFCIANRYYLSVIFSFLLAFIHHFKGSILSFRLGMSTQKPYFASHLQLKMSNISHPNYVLYLWSSLAVPPSLPHSLFLFSLPLSHNQAIVLFKASNCHCVPQGCFVTAYLIYRERTNIASTAFYAVKEGNFN